MSLSRPTDNEFISPETFLDNQVKIEQARKLLEEMEEKNRLGLQKFTEREQQQREQLQLLKKKEELQKKIQEGLQAQLFLEELDKRHSTLSIEHIPTETSAVGSARIEEIVLDNSQLPVASEVSVAQNISPVQNQFPQWPEYRATQTVPYYPVAPASSRHPSQTSNKFTNYNSASPHTSTFFNETASRYSSEIHKQNESLLYEQRRPVKSSRNMGNGTIIHRAEVATKNVTNQEQGHMYTGATSSAVPYEVLQPVQPQQQPQIRYVDSYGVPYLPFTDEQVFEMEKRSHNLQRHAPAGMMDKLHELIFLLKDTSPIPTTWIYVLETPTSKRYNRTSEIDKFFKVLLDNSRLARISLGGPSQAPVPLAKSSIPNNEYSSRTANVQSAASETPDVQQANNPHSPSLSTSTNFENPGPHHAVETSTSSTTFLAKEKPSSLATPAKSSNIDSTTPYFSTRKLALPSAVDKKRLSQNILYALGKRTRPSDNGVPEGQPTKKFATSPAVTSQSARMVPSAPVPAQMALTTAPSDRASSSGSQVPTFSTSHSTSAAQPSLDESSGLVQQTPVASKVPEPPNAVGPSTADATSGKNVQQCSASNPYAPLLSFTPNNVIGAASEVSSINPSQYADQQLKPQTYPVASSSLHAPNPSNNVSPTSPHDRNNILDAKEPLFLPSSSPEADSSESVFIKPEKGSTRCSPLNDKMKARKQFFVLVPPPPDYLVRLRQQKGSKALEQSDTETARKQFQRLKTGTSSVSSSVIGEVIDSEPQSDIENFERERQEAIDLSCTRLQAVPCKWDGCNVILNSYKSLTRHLNIHIPSRSVNRTHFICRWTSCGKMCNFGGAHLLSHSLSTMYCAYADCRASFRSGSQLLRHHNSDHKQSDKLRPSAGLLAPVIDSVPEIPSKLPVYSLFTRMVQPASITPERHEVICPWVIRTIINSDQEKRSKLRTRKTAKAPSRPIPTMGNEYEFITTRSTRYSSYLSQAVDLPLKDLEPTVISQMIDEGLILWPSKDANISHEPIRDSLSSSPVVPRIQTSGIVKEEVVDAPVHQVNSSGLALHHPEQSNDEETVKVLLMG